MSDGRDSFNLDDYLRADPPSAPGPPVSRAPGPPVVPFTRSAPTRVVTFSRPRTGWLLASGATALCGLLLAAYGVAANLPVSTAFAAWVMATWGGTLLLAVYRHVDACEQARPGYVLAPSTKVLGVAVPILIVAGAVVSSLGIATWAGGA